VRHLRKLFKWTHLCQWLNLIYLLARLSVKLFLFRLFHLIYIVFLSVFAFIEDGKSFGFPWCKFIFHLFSSLCHFIFPNHTICKFLSTFLALNFSLRGIIFFVIIRFMLLRCIVECSKFKWIGHIVLDRSMSGSRRCLSLIHRFQCFVVKVCCISIVFIHHHIKLIFIFIVFSDQRNFWCIILIYCSWVRSLIMILIIISPDIKRCLNSPI